MSMKNKIDSKNSEDKKKIHKKILDQFLIIAAGYDMDFFSPLIDGFASGLDNPAKYNLTVRQLSCLSDPRATMMLQEILPYRLILNISITEKNNDDLCAFDYAKKHNLNSYNLLKNHEAILPKGSNLDEEFDEKDDQEYQNKPNFFSQSSEDVEVDKQTNPDCFIS